MIINQAANTISCTAIGAAKKFIAIELKAGNNTLTRLQRKFLTEAKEAGAICAVCYFLEEVKELIEWVDNLCPININVPCLWDEKSK